MKSKKCFVCDWEIKDDGIRVTVGGKEIIVCCDECAEKARQNADKRAAQAR